MPVLHTLKVLAALGTLSSAAWVSTFADFSDTGTASSGSFTTGTLNLKLGGADNTTLTALALPNAKPGDSVYAPLVVSNPGSTVSSLALKYSMTSAATGDSALGTALRVGVRTGVTACDAAGYAQSGTQLLASTTTLAAAALTARPLVAGASETLCVHLTLPTEVVDNDLQGKTSGLAFSFTATSD